MRRKRFPASAIKGLIVALACVVARHGSAATAAPAVLRAIAVAPSSSATRLQLRIDGDFVYKTLMASSDTMFIDLTGARADHIAKSGDWSGGLLTGYRLALFTDAAQHPVVRVQVEMKHSELYQVERTEHALVVSFGNTTAVTSPEPAAVRETTATSVPKVAAKPSENVQPATSATAGPVDVSALFVSSGPEGEVHVDVDMAQPTNYRVLKLENPRRLVLDLDGAHKTFHQNAFRVQSPLASGVRVGQFRAENPSVVRVVVDLSGDPIFDVHARPGGVRIDLKSRLTASAHPAPPALKETVPPALQGTAPTVAKALQPAVAQPSAATPNRQAGYRPESAKVGAGIPQSLPLNPTSIAYMNLLPANVQSRGAVAMPSPVPASSTREVVAAAKAAKVMAGGIATNETATEAQVTASSGQAPAATSVVEQPHYSGEPISVNLKDVDLKDFFRLIHEISGLNILVDPNVTGSVTMVLDNVPWDQALDIVLKDNNLGKTLEGNVLRISKLETLAAEQEVVSKLSKARQEAQPLVTRFIPISYAKASDIAGLLKTVAGGGALSSRGTAVVDARTNTVIVTDIAGQMPVIDQIIAKLDTKAKQVSIEGRVIVANKHFERDLASALNYGNLNPSGSVVSGGATGASPSASAQGDIQTSIPGTPRVTIGQTNVSGFGAFVISNTGHAYFINAMIAAAETRNDARTISKPMIVTQNNIQGMVQQGTQVPIQTTINLTVTTQFVPIVLQLQVTPQVTADGNIFMIINVSNNTVTTTNFGPSIATQSATTQVLVPDGGTVVFGGITVNTESRAATYVPWIGDIPVIGHLFKNTTHTKDDSELLFFITPKVLPG